MTQSRGERVWRRTKDRYPEFYATLREIADERRKSARVSLCVSVGFLGDNNFFTGFTEDISEGGLFVATYTLEPIGTEIELTFTLPNGYEVAVRGQVKWVREANDYAPATPPGMGLQFINLAPCDAAILRDFVAKREPMFYST